MKKDKCHFAFFSIGKTKSMDLPTNQAAFTSSKIPPQALNKTAFRQSTINALVYKSKITHGTSVYKNILHIIIFLLPLSYCLSVTTSEAAYLSHSPKWSNEICTLWYCNIAGLTFDTNGIINVIILYVLSEGDEGGKVGRGCGGERWEQMSWSMTALYATPQHQDLCHFIATLFPWTGQNEKKTQPR